MPDLRGKSVGRYHIIEMLGEGGMATVYRAVDNKLERDVAIKVIRTELFGPAVLEPLLKRFEREAKTLANMQHPNIVHVLDYGEFENDPFLVMQYLPGGTLKSFTGKAMPFQDAARLLAPIARALSYAHRQGIIHRDVKPANILLTKDGNPMLSDFGIAKILESEQSTQLTVTGMSIGTPEYMAPEQWTGNVSPKVDIYALGVIFYELVTGRRPFTADTPAALMIQASLDPLPPPRKFVPNLPEEVEEILIKALAKQPENRFASMSEFSTILELLAKCEETNLQQLKTASLIKNTDLMPISASRPATRETPPPVYATSHQRPEQARMLVKSIRRVPWWIWALGGLGVLGAIALVVGFALAFLSQNGDNPAAASMPTSTITHTVTPAASEAPSATLAPQSTPTDTPVPSPTTTPAPAPTSATETSSVQIYPIDSAARMDYTSIWSMTTPKFTDMKSPGTQTYTAGVNHQEQYRWEFAWCAVDNQTLQNILTPLSLWFIIDGGQPLSDAEISLSHGKSYQGMECQYWDIVLGDWEQGKQVKLDISISLSKAINDGVDDYEAGQYHQIILVNPK